MTWERSDWGLPDRGHRVTDHRAYLIGYTSPSHIATAGLDLVRRQTLAFTRSNVEEEQNVLFPIISNSKGICLIPKCNAVNCSYQHFCIFLCVHKSKSRSEEPCGPALRSVTIYTIGFMTFDHELSVVLQLLFFFFFFFFFTCTAFALKRFQCS